VLIVSVELPEPPVIVAGLKPPFETPVGKPASAATDRATFPVKPTRGVTVTVKAADWPGVTDRQSGVTSMSKSPLAGLTVMIRVGGLGSEFPLASIAVIETTYVPAAGKVTLFEPCDVEVPGTPPGNTHEYCDTPAAALKESDPPAVMVVSDAGAVMLPSGGGPANGESWMNFACEGTPALLSRKSM
jgi:hypothetical protein